MSSNSSDPASAPQEPNENRGPVVTAVTLWMLGFSTCFIVLRCVSRLGVVKRWSWDDTFISIAWVRAAAVDSLCNTDMAQVLAFGFSFSICWGVRNGLGLHEEYVQPGDELALRKSEYVFSVLYVCAHPQTLGLEPTDPSSRTQC